MFETILVVLIVAAVFIAAGRSLYRIITNRKSGQCCGCGSCMYGSSKKEEI